MSRNSMVSAFVGALAVFAFSLDLAGDLPTQGAGDAASKRAPSVSTPPDESSNGGLRVVDIGMVAPNIVALTLRAGKIVHGNQLPYQEQPGDWIERHARHRAVFRSGVYIGTLVGRDQNIIHSADRFVGDRLPAEIDSPEVYSVSSKDDPFYSSETHPITVARKTKPLDIALAPRRGSESATESVLYLSLPRALVEGRTYRVEFGLEGVAPAELTYDVDRLRSDAVHVSHVGFHPDDPVKLAFLSTWMGSGGPLDYDEGLGFQIIDNQTDEIVYEGRTTLAKSWSEAEDASGRNFNGTNVYVMEFDDLREEGEFVAVVDGIGRSYPFRIDRNAWKRAFYVSVRGFYHQRSGIELGPPHTTYRRPRPFHPDDGVSVYQSSSPLMWSGNGLSYGAQRRRSSFDGLVEGRLDRTLRQAWGGYMDAGDWDRRIQHLRVSRYLMELAEMFPGYFEQLRLNIPEASPELPDVISEARFGLDFYRRMQGTDGGVRGGVESADHPRRGEASWQESLDVMAYAPGVWSSHWYAGVAARAAFLLRRLDPGLAKDYQRSAVAAMEYAERRWPELGPPDAQAGGVIDARNLAAVELYRLTGEPRWHDVFLSTTVFADQERLSRWPEFDQADAAWVYVRTTRRDVDRGIQTRCRRAILGEADARVAQTSETGFRWTKDPWSGAAWGAFSAPDGISMARAHRLTGDQKYLRGLILATQHGAGANPLNMSYTTGIGAKTPEHPLHIDSRVTGQPPPPGLTIFGPLGFKEGRRYWGQSLADPFLYPPFESWPTTEAYWDIYVHAPMNEYSVHGPMARNAYVWGYLAAASRP